MMNFNKSSSNQNVNVCSKNNSIVFWHFNTILLVSVFIFFKRLFTVYNWTVDDAFITYRYAKNLSDTGSITWNSGNLPVEGYTNFLLVLIASVSEFLKISTAPFIKTLSIFVFVAALIFYLMNSLKMGLNRYIKCTILSYEIRDIDSLRADSRRAGIRLGLRPCWRAVP